MGGEPQPFTSTRALLKHEGLSVDSCLLKAIIAITCTRALPALQVEYTGA